MENDHQAAAVTAETDFPGRSKRAGSTSGDENYGGTKEQKTDPSPPDAENKPSATKPLTLPEK